MKRTKTIYIVVIRRRSIRYYHKKSSRPMFEFKTKELRQEFLDECIKKDNTFEYATTEMEVSDVEYK